MAVGYSALPSVFNLQPIHLSSYEKRGIDGDNKMRRFVDYPCFVSVLQGKIDDTLLASDDAFKKIDK